MHIEDGIEEVKKNFKVFDYFYLREQKSLVIIAVVWWRLLFSRIRGSCKYEVYSGYSGLCSLQLALLVL